MNKFAAGVDECQPIELNSADLDAIIFAVKNRELPHTQGFFFGASPTDESAVLEQIEDDVRIFEDAKQWLADRPENEARSVIYQASW